MQRSDLPTTPSAITTAAGTASRSPWVERLGTMGFTAKGVLYLVIAAIAGSVGLGGGEASQTGAIEQLGQQTYGTVILVLLAVGLAGYALLRLVHVVVDPSGESGAKGAAMRASYLVRAVVYGGLTWVTVRALTGSGGGGGNREQQVTATVLEWPFGPWLVGGAAVVLAVVALYQLKKAFTRDFMDQLHATGTARTVTVWAGTIGHAARALLFGTIAVLLGRAALQSDASESGGLSQAFQELSSTPAGTSLLTATAIGVAGYGVWCLAMAAWGTARRAE
jgi:hypothetical protein